MKTETNKGRNNTLSVRTFIMFSLMMAMGTLPVGLYASEVPPSSVASSPADSTELAKRVAELRQEMAPFLESRPKPLAVRRRQNLCGDDWLSKFEIQRVSESPLTIVGKKKSDGTQVKVPESPGWEAPGIDVSGWEKTSVPEWRYDALPLGRQPASCILWYRKTFTAKMPRDQERVFLVFEGVDWEAEVWLNGQRLGGHSVYFEPFRFDVTSLIGERNTLAVRVIDGPQFGEPAAYWAVFPVPHATEQRYVRDRARSLVGLKKGDTHIGSGYGIHRDVYLETTAAAAISEIRVRGYPAKGETTVQVATDIIGKKPAALMIEMTSDNCEGRSFSRRVVFAPDATGWQRVVVPMPDARRWSPQAPCLYRCRVSLLDEKDCSTDSSEAVFGYRTVEMVSELHPHDRFPPGMLLLDGEPLFLRGANIQGLNALWYWGEHDKLLDTLLLLKAANFNSVRFCQHVAFPEVLELLDRLGILSEQDVGSRYPGLGEQVRPGLLAASAAITRVCYNNPGVALLSFANETKFDPTDMLQAALAHDPERLFVPISGNEFGGYARPNAGRKGYKLSDKLWASVVDDVHPYWGWYGYIGLPSKFCQVLPPDRLVTVGEYGSEALDSYETMSSYPADWGPRPAKTADVLWGHVQVVKNDIRQQVGLRGVKPANLGEYITASQNYQYDQLIETTKSWRLSPRRVSGYFQFHFIDVLPANWPKSIVSHDLTPKRGFFAMAQINQPLVPLFRVLPGGKSMELWVANDQTQAFPGCVIRWSVGKGQSVVKGDQKVDVLPSDAVMSGVADLKNLPDDLQVADVELILENKDGTRIGRYRQEVYLAAWKQKNAPVEKPAAGGTG